MNKIEPSMLLINSPWNNMPSFKLIPVHLDCPYQEVLYDPAGKTLAIISKTPKQHYAMVPKLNDDGEPIKAKGPRTNGKPYKEERRIIDTYAEYYIETLEEIGTFIGLFAINADSFNVERYINPPAAKKALKVDPALTGMSVVKPEPEQVG